MANYKLALPKTLTNEGGYANVVGDRGKLTYRGIASAFWSSWKGFELIRKWVAIHGEPKEGKVFTEQEIPGLAQLVDEFYKEHFWDEVKGDEIINQEVAEDLFDKAVNMGIGQAVKLCQRSLDITETGKMDKSTLNILNVNNPYA